MKPYAKMNKVFISLIYYLMLYAYTSVMDMDTYIMYVNLFYACYIKLIIVPYLLNYMYMHVHLYKIIS